MADSNGNGFQRVPKPYSLHAQILGVKGGEKLEDVKMLYLASAKKYHPDTNGNASSVKATKQFQAVSESWEFFQAYFKNHQEASEPLSYDASAAVLGVKGGETRKDIGELYADAMLKHPDVDTRRRIIEAKHIFDYTLRHSEDSRARKPSATASEASTSAPEAEAKPPEPDNEYTTIGSKTDLGFPERGVRVRPARARDVPPPPPPPPPPPNPAWGKPQGRTFRQPGFAQQGQEQQQPTGPLASEPKKSFFTKKLFVTTAILAALGAYGYFRGYKPWVATAHNKQVKMEQNTKARTSLDGSVLKQTLDHIKPDLLAKAGKMSVMDFEQYAKKNASSGVGDIDENKLVNSTGPKPYFESKPVSQTANFQDVDPLSEGRKRDNRTMTTEATVHYSVRSATMPAPDVLQKAGIAPEGAKAFTLRGAAVVLNHDYTTTGTNVGAIWTGNDEQDRTNVMNEDAKRYKMDHLSYTVIFDKQMNRYVIDKEGVLVHSVKAQKRNDYNSIKSPASGSGVSDPKPNSPSSNKWQQRGFISQNNI